MDEWTPNASRQQEGSLNHPQGTSRIGRNNDSNNARELPRPTTTTPSRTPVHTPSHTPTANVTTNTADIGEPVQE
jgi:hypothetical protein